MNKFLLIVALCVWAGAVKGAGKDPGQMIDEMEREQENLFKTIDSAKMQNTILHGESERYHRESVVEIALAITLIGMLHKYVDNVVYKKLFSAVPAVIILRAFWNMMSNYIADGDTQNRVDSLTNRFRGLGRSIEDIKKSMHDMPLAPVRTKTPPDKGLTRFVKTYAFGQDVEPRLQSETDEEL